jgi:glycosyltransferase involved in cell wall biosynthesis
MRILQYTNEIVDLVGGAERVFCEMANAFVARGHEVYTVCNDFRTGRPFYPLDDRVHFINLNGTGRRKRKPLIWRISRPFRFLAKDTWDRFIGDSFNKVKSEPLVKLIQEIQPDVVIPYQINDYFAMYRQPMLDVPAILMHHSNADLFARFLRRQENIEKINTCSHLQVLQRIFVPEIQQFYRGPIHVIPNVVPQVEEMDLADLTVKKPQRTITMISRLDVGKQQHLLIQAFGRLAKNYPDWKVEIYGPPSKQKYHRQLKDMIVALGLVGRVELMGRTNNPLDVLRTADIFAFPSNYPEGFPLALTEAMAVGLPCVGLKTTPSVNELIVDGVNGLLADNTPEDFAEKLKILMDDQNLRAKMGRAGHEMMKQYAPEKIWDQWEELIETVVRQHRQRKVT